MATTQEQAAALLRDAAAILQARAELLAATGRRVWEPSPDRPALVIIIDEYAELTNDAHDAMSYADSIARLGRAVAVTLVAATQRPTTEPPAPAPPARTSSSGSSARSTRTASSRPTNGDAAPSTPSVTCSD